MDGGRAGGGVMQGGAYGGGGGIDLQGPLQIDHPNTGYHHHHAHQLQQQQQQQQQQYVSQQAALNAPHPQTHDMFPQSASKDVQDPQQQQQPHHHVHHHHQHTQQQLHQQQQGFLPPEHRKIERMPSISEDDDPSLTTEGGGMEGCGKGGKKGSASSQWHRMKWTGTMVKLLITIVSYIGEDASGADFSGGGGGGCGGGGRRKFPSLQKKGKWKSVSKVMAERGHYVSPQQCEDKFNDLNKRYKRLNDILGRGVSCQVVENPMLMDRLEHVTEKGKEDVRKILSSKHLFYEEMCSYHNGNRLHLPADPEVQRLLQLALQSREESDTKRNSQDDSDDDDQGGDSDEDDDLADQQHGHRDDTAGSGFPKRMKLSNTELTEYTSAPPQDGNRNLSAPGFSVDMNQVFSETPIDEQPQSQMLAYKVQLQEQQLQIQADMMELERQRFKWQRFSKKKDRDLEKMRLENERMKLENERLTLELKRRQLELQNH